MRVTLSYRAAHDPELRTLRIDNPRLLLRGAILYLRKTRPASTLDRATATIEYASPDGSPQTVTVPLPALESYLLAHEDFP